MKKIKIMILFGILLLLFGCQNKDGLNSEKTFQKKEMIATSDGGGYIGDTNNDSFR